MMKLLEKLENVLNRCRSNYVELIDVELIDVGVKVNNFDEMKKEIIEHVKNLKEQGADVKVDEDQINDLINKIFDKKYEKYEKKHI